MSKHVGGYDSDSQELSTKLLRAQLNKREGETVNHNERI